MDNSAFGGPLTTATIKGSTVVNGILLLAPEVFADDDVRDDSSGEPVFGALGIVARPLDPDADGAAEAVCARSSDGLPVLALRDVRLETAAAVGLEKGTIRLCGYRGIQLSMSVAPSGTGSIATLYVPFAHDGDGVPTKGHVLTLDPTTDSEQIRIAHANGCSIALTDDAVTINGPDGSTFASVDNDGLTLSGDLRVANSNLVVGDPTLAQDVALAQPSIDFNTIAGQILTLVVAAVNSLAPGTISPSQIVQLGLALAPYLAGGATTRAPRILGQPGP